MALGSGQLDWPTILHAAVDDGVKYYYIEDESPEAPRQVPVTKAFLSMVRY